jgi:hypothetical protein
VWLVLGAVALLMLVPIGGAAKAHGTRAWTSLAVAAVAVCAGGVLAVAVAVVAPHRVHYFLNLLIPAAIVWGCLANHALTKYR